MATYNQARKKIKDRGIRWKETYTDKTLGLKKKYEKLLGPGSYFRWEGHDPTENNDYYIVVGPGHTRGSGTLFFAGVRKMPANYPPNGEYFKTLRQAMAYAKNMWGIRFPRDFQNYTQDQLAQIQDMDEDE